MKKYLFVCLFLWYGSANSTPIANNPFAMGNGLNGNMPDAISLERIVNIISTGDVLSFDYRIGWTIVGRGAPPHPVGGHSILNRSRGASTFDSPRNQTGSLSRGGIGSTSSSGAGASINFFLTDPENVLLDSMPVSSVPIPATVWMVGTGLLGLMGIRKKKSKV